MNFYKIEIRRVSNSSFYRSIDFVDRSHYLAKRTALTVLEIWNENYREGGWIVELKIFSKEKEKPFSRKITYKSIFYLDARLKPFRDKRTVTDIKRLLEI
ncbi:hypothetical protein C0583_02190 [Candidatus Parcubacteria bacterium]|nr:MAG: hypothetical protein C0583_02190 [Candidatus Parcubacteria bacterium]